MPDLTWTQIDEDKCATRGPDGRLWGIMHGWSHGHEHWEIVDEAGTVIETDTWSLDHAKRWAERWYQAHDIEVLHAATKAIWTSIEVVEELIFPHSARRLLHHLEDLRDRVPGLIAQCQNLEPDDDEDDDLDNYY